jgi:hypothetical protein
MARVPRVGLPTPTLEPRVQREFSRTVKEALEISQRQRGKKGDSFVRLEELQTLGLADTEGNPTNTATSIVATADRAFRRLRALIHLRGT